MDKQAIRQSILAKLNKHSDKSIKEKTNIISGKLLSRDDYSRSKTIFLYISKKEEVGTYDIIAHSLSIGKKIYAPAIKNKKIMACNVKKIDELKKGRFQIMEPPISTTKNKFDMIIVPAIAFDAKGARLGRGGGYFDRFLSQAKGTRVGLAFDFQIVDKITSEPHDMRVDKIITENRTIDTSSG